MNSTSLKGSTPGEHIPSQPGSKTAQAKSKAQTKGLTAFGLVFKGQDKGKGAKPEELDAKAKEAAAAQLAQLMMAQGAPKPDPKSLKGAPEDAATSLALTASKRRGTKDATDLHAQQLQLASEPTTKLGKNVHAQAELAPSPMTGAILPAGSQMMRQDLPGRQDFTASLDHIQRALSSNTDAQYDHQLLLRTFEGGGQLELELGSGDMASRLRMIVQDQRVELGFDGKAHAQLDKIKQTLIESGFEVTVVPMTSDAQGHDQALDQQQRHHHEAARAALEVRLRLRGAQRWEDAPVDRADDPHETSRKQARLGVLVDEIV